MAALTATSSDELKAAAAIAVDPTGCGCTECLLGVYVPLERATVSHMRLMLFGFIRDHTNERFSYSDGELRAEYSGRTWRLHPAI